VGAIRGADAGRDSFTCFDRDREGRPERRPAAAGRGHQRELQSFHLLGGQREADQTATVHGHEVDRRRGDSIGGHAQIAFILAILVIHEDHQLACANVVDRTLHAAQRLRFDVQRARVWLQGANAHGSASARVASSQRTT
jgi:hypothetical protein